MYNKVINYLLFLYLNNIFDLINNWILFKYSFILALVLFSYFTFFLNKPKVIYY